MIRTGCTLVCWLVLLTPLSAYWCERYPVIPVVWYWVPCVPIAPAYIIPVAPQTPANLPMPRTTPEPPKAKPKPKLLLDVPEKKSDPTPIEEKKITPEIPKFPVDDVPPPKPKLNAKNPESEPSLERFVIDNPSGVLRIGLPRVKFYNHSERDLTLIVEQKEMKVKSGEILKLNVPLNFVWSEKGGFPNQEKIPESALGLDIVIKK